MKWVIAGRLTRPNSRTPSKMDAIEKPAEAKPPIDEVVRQFLEDMKAAALYAQDHVVHLCAFRVTGESAIRRRGGGSITELSL